MVGGPSCLRAILLLKFINLVVGWVILPVLYLFIDLVNSFPQKYNPRPVAEILAPPQICFHPIFFCDLKLNTRTTPSWRKVRRPEKKNTPKKYWTLRSAATPNGSTRTPPRPKIGST